MEERKGTASGFLICVTSVIVMPFAVIRKPEENIVGEDKLNFKVNIKHGKIFYKMQSLFLGNIQKVKKIPLLPLIKSIIII